MEKKINSPLSLPLDIHVFNLSSGAKQRELKSITTKNELIEIAACRAGNANDQFVVMIDSNGELYIVQCQSLTERSQDSLKSSLSGQDNAEMYKIGTQVTAVKWASETNILVGLHDTSYSIWYCAGEGCTDSTIINLTTVNVDIR